MLRLVTNWDTTSEAPPTISAKVGVLGCEKAQKLSQIIQNVNKKLPLRSFGLYHAKRVKKCQESRKALVLLAPVSHSHLIDCANLAQDFDSVCIVEVPSIPPVTTQQLHLWNEIWPMTFHEGQQKTFETICDEKEKRICVFIQSQIKDMSLNFICTSTCIITDNNLAILSSHTSNFMHDQDFLPHRHSVIQAISKVVHQQPIEADMPNSYLCQDLYCFCDVEPCVMCCMALVHSRIEKVFFCIKSEFGALESVERMGILKGLNHHFASYKYVEESAVAASK